MAKAISTHSTSIGRATLCSVSVRAMQVPLVVFLLFFLMAFVSTAEAKDKKQTKSVPIKTLVNTAGVGVGLAPFIKPYNDAIVDLKCSKSDGSVIIKFGIDTGQWDNGDSAFGKWPHIFMLVRLFDRNGEYLTHFTTAEVFTTDETAFENYKNAIRSGVDAETSLEKRGIPVGKKLPKPVLLKPRQNTLEYPINRRDLRDAEVVEVGFTTRR
ncbi:MAG: hypothetical protein HY897_26130 [Deltaproteobacteria bacterium]|nr:hypothetical protein [Deltaproteobacteria bacterium]